MSFTASLATTGKTAVITLTGKLDDSSAEQFRQKVATAAGQDVDRLVLEVSKLDELSSAGLRGLAFCREKMSHDVAIVFVAPGEQVRAAIAGSDFDKSVTIADNFTP